MPLLPDLEASAAAGKGRGLDVSWLLSVPVARDSCGMADGGAVKAVFLTYGLLSVTVSSGVVERVILGLLGAPSVLVHIAEVEGVAGIWFAVTLRVLSRRRYQLGDESLLDAGVD